jgi:hypothetical protein
MTNYFPSFNSDDAKHFINSSYLIPNESFSENKLIRSESYTASKQLLEIEKILIQIISSDEELFPLKRDSHLGEDLLMYLKLAPNFREYFPYSSLSPYLNVFMKTIANIEGNDRKGYRFNAVLRRRASKARIKGRYKHWDMSSPPRNNRQTYCDLMNGFVAKLRKKLRSDEFSKSVANLKKGISKNKNSLLKYIKALFNVHSRLLVIRLDLSYKKQSTPYLKMHEFCDQLEKAQDHRHKLIQHLKRKQLKDALVGYAWKLEYGLEKSFHYHMIFFIDGSRYKKDVEIAKSIGEHWVQQITEGNGLYWNCNANQDSYRANGIGTVNYWDKDKRKNLEQASLYLVKPDYFVRVFMPNGGKSYDRGQMPKNIETRGRKRSKEI